MAQEKDDADREEEEDNYLEGWVDKEEQEVKEFWKVLTCTYS
jgi:hypothetical protein